MDNNRFTFFQSYSEALEQIEDAEEFRACCIALWTYALTGEDCAASSTSRMFMSLVKPTIDKSKAIRDGAKNGGSHTKAYTKPTESHSEAYTKPIASPSEAYSKPTGSPSEQDIGVRSKEKGPKSTRFTPPTLDDVKEYCRKRNSPVDPVKFYQYFTEGNWTDSKGQKVKNWKQKLITWEQHQTAEKARSGTKFGDFEQNHYDKSFWDELEGIGG